MDLHWTCILAIYCEREMPIIGHLLSEYGYKFTVSKNCRDVQNINRITDFFLWYGKNLAKLIGACRFGNRAIIKYLICWVFSIKRRYLIAIQAGTISNESSKYLISINTRALLSGVCSSKWIYYSANIPATNFSNHCKCLKLGFISVWRSKTKNKSEMETISEVAQPTRNWIFKQNFLNISTILPFRKGLHRSTL